MWKFSYDLLEQFSMLVNEVLAQAGPHKLRIEEIEENRDKIKEAIGLITEVNEDVLTKYLAHPIKKNVATNEFVNKIHRDMKKEVVDKICDGELELEKMNMSKLEDITKACQMWMSYVEDLAFKKAS